LGKVDEKSDRHREVADRSAEKIVKGYVPPVIVIGRFESGKITGVTAYEETATSVILAQTPECLRNSIVLKECSEG
jgi:hypothetical protein